MRILRVDDRLVHGQVIAGWARPLGMKTLILASNKISQDEWACNAYRLAVPEGIAFSCVTLDNCIGLVHASNEQKMMIIVESVREAYNLVKGGLAMKEVNIGGLGYRQGTREVAPYIYLTAEDIESVVLLYHMGIKVIGKQLPNSAPIDVARILAGVRQ